MQNTLPRWGEVIASEQFFHSGFSGENPKKSSCLGDICGYLINGAHQRRDRAIKAMAMARTTPPSSGVTSPSWATASKTALSISVYASV